MGGICALTEWEYRDSGKREFWPPADVEMRVKEIIITMKEIILNFNLMTHDARMCFIPEAGIDLLAYNKVAVPYPWHKLIIQNRLEVEIEETTKGNEITEL